MNKIALPLAHRLFLTSALLLVACAAARSDEAPRRTMTLTGTGIVQAVPDRAVLTLGVQTEADAAADALVRNNEAMWAVMEALTNAGLETEDVRTATFSITPQTIDSKKSRSGLPEIVGYRVTNEVHATVRDLDKLGTLLDKAVSAGSNKVNDIRFEVSESEPLLNEARRLATRDALAKAELYAQAAGVRLGPITEITEVAAGPRPRFQRTIALEQANVPLAAGKLSLEMQVNITWALAD